MKRGETMPTRKLRGRPKELPKNALTHLTCTVCKKDRPRAQYFVSNKDIWSENGVCQICKECLATMLVDEKTKQISIDNWNKVLSFLDIPHIPALFTKLMMEQDTTMKNIIGKYKKLLNLNVEFKEMTYMDSVQYEIDFEEIKNNNVKINKETTEFWGLGYEPKEYLRFENRYKRLIANEKEGTLDYIKEIYYKSLPKLELQAEKQLMAGDTKAHKDTMATIKEICSVCNINPIQIKEENANQGTYDLFIKRIENEDPVFDFERDLGNKDEVKEFLELYLYGYLYEANNMTTPVTERLHEELERFTPTVESLMDEEDYEEGED